MLPVKQESTDISVHLQIHAQQEMPRTVTEIRGLNWQLCINERQYLVLNAQN